MPDEASVELGVMAGTDVEFRAQTIYFVVLDRFAAGKPDKPREDDEMFDPAHQDWNKYWGGDLQGLLDKLAYLQGFGISAVWTTPLFEQIRSMTCGDVPRAPLHGYWTSDFKRINPRWMNDPSEKRLFTRDDTVFDKLLEEMHRRGMSFVLDIVCNHSSPENREGKGKLYDDGKLIADFDNDTNHWYHHYGEVQDWGDEWQLQNAEVAGLATFNENNILFRNHIKEAIGLWIRKGVDALRVDTVKHMPLWFWQELMADLDVVNPALFRFGEWIHSHPEDARSVEFSNKAGMSILDFGFCLGVRECLAKGQGFGYLQGILDQDGKYDGATELVTFFENHDMPRLQSLGASAKMLELALVLLLCSRGVPCLYYGCEQYLHDDREGGNDPYSRPMMSRWDETEAMRLIGVLARERRENQAIQWGGQWPKFVDDDVYIFLRRYRDSRCLVCVNKGAVREIEVPNLDFPPGNHTCLLGGAPLKVEDGRALIKLEECSARVFAWRGPTLEAKVIVRVQVNGAPTQPGDRLAVIGDCPELGRWDLREAHDLECVNGNTWFGEIPFEESTGRPVGYKFVIFPAGENSAPRRENRLVRRRLLVPEGCAKWRDEWEGC